MFVSEEKFENLNVGMKVISSIGTEGIISELLPIEEDYRKEDNLVSFNWSNGKESKYCWHFQCNKIQLCAQ